MNPRELLIKARDWYQGLSLREQRLVAAAGVVACIALLYIVLVLPFQTMAAKRAARVEKKTADLAWMRQVAPQVAAASSRGTQSATGESLVVLVDRTARQAGLGSALRDQSPNGANSLRLRMESASFDSLVAWLAELQQQHGVTIEAANVDVGSAPGLVNASVTIGKAGAG